VCQKLVVDCIPLFLQRSPTIPAKSLHASTKYHLTLVAVRLESQALPWLAAKGHELEDIGTMVR
jgi:hypothetical protein